MATETAKSGGRIGVDQEGHIVTVTLDSPHRRNAVTNKMWREIGDLFANLGESGAARVVILRGAGRDFSAGADISEFDRSRRDAETAFLYEQVNSRAFAAIRDCSLPVVAAIRGVCFGGGFGLAAACDIRIGSHDAVFSIPAARLGLAYPQDAMVDIVSSCGSQAARFLAYTGARISAADALNYGFLLALHDANELDVAAMSLAQSIAANAPLSIKASKAAIDAVITGSIEKERLAREFGAATFDSDDYSEGRSAFREKRNPHFKGK